MQNTQFSASQSAPQPNQTPPIVRTQSQIQPQLENNTFSAAPSQLQSNQVPHTKISKSNPLNTLIQFTQKNWIMIAITVTVFAALTIGFLLVQGVFSLSSQNITVVGTSSQETQANSAILSVIYNVQGSSQSEVTSKAESQLSTAISQLSQLEMVRISRSQPQFGSNQNIAQYAQGLQITISEITQLNAVYSILNNTPNTSIIEVRFLATDENLIKAELLGEAVENARQKAKQTVEKSGLRLGKIISISEITNLEEGSLLSSETIGETFGELQSSIEIESAVSVTFAAH